MLDPWYLHNLRCPVDGQPLSWNEEEASLVSANGLRYPVLDGIPVMLPIDNDPTIEGIRASLATTAAQSPWYLDSVFVSNEQRQGIRTLIEAGSTDIDPVAAFLVAATNGIGYAHLVGKFTHYPIPDIRLEEGRGRQLLDIGCSWGRWSIAAARQGWNPVGIDPSIGAVMAARRVSQQLGITNAKFVVGDARQLPFAASTFDAAFSYSVIQHFSPEAARRTFQEIGRILNPGGQVLVQMPTKWGLRCLYNQLWRGFREPRRFEVRYWSLKDLASLCNETVGSTRFSVDCFFGIGWQVSDLEFMPGKLRTVIYASEIFRRLSLRMPFLTRFADSVYVHAEKPAT